MTSNITGFSVKDMKSWETQSWHGNLSFHERFYECVSYSDLLLPPAGCGGDLAGPAGSFNSPGYPNKYPANRECVWYIQTSPGSSITITIHEFDIEHHPDCNYDLLEVKQSSILFYPCFSLSEPHCHVSNKIKLILQND